jgi:hypothetical protein
VEAPVYDQAETENCWSVALTMLLNAYGANEEPWHANAFFGIDAEHGLKFASYIHAQAIVEFIHGWLPDVTVERRNWRKNAAIDETDALLAYLYDNAVAGKPTMFYRYNPIAHMILVVGVDNGSFVVHDPAHADGNGAYDILTREELIDSMDALGPNNGTGTLTFDRPRCRRRASCWWTHAGPIRRACRSCTATRRATGSTSATACSAGLSRAGARRERPIWMASRPPSIATRGCLRRSPWPTTCWARPPSP